MDLVSFRLILSGAPFCELRCTRSVHFGGIVPFIINRTVEIHHQTPHEIEVKHDQLLDLEPDLLIMYKMISDQDRSLHVSRVLTWVVQIYFPAIFNTNNKLDSPMCDDF